MSTERDILAGRINAAIEEWDDAEPGKYAAHVAGHIADAVLSDGYRKPQTIDNDKLLIQDGLLLLDVGACTCTPYGSSHEPHCSLEYLDDLTKPLERAGYRKPRTITTVEELDALPFGSVILDRSGLSLHKNEFTGWRASNGAKDIDEAMLEQEAFPATVLHEGGAS